MRTFKVYIFGHNQGKKPLRLPCEGQPLYTGEQALAVMEDYRATRPALVAQAVTKNKHAADGFEVCSLSSMRAIFRPMPEDEDGRPIFQGVGEP